MSPYRSDMDTSCVSTELASAAREKFTSAALSADLSYVLARGLNAGYRSYNLEDHLWRYLKPVEAVSLLAVVFPWTSSIDTNKV